MPIPPAAHYISCPLQRHLLYLVGAFNKSPSTVKISRRFVDICRAGLGPAAGVVAYCQAAEGEYRHATHCYKEHTPNYTSYILANCIQCCRHPLTSTEYCLIAKTALLHYIIFFLPSLKMSLLPLNRN